MSGGASWNPFEIGRGTQAAGYVDLPLARLGGGKLSYEILVGLSLARSRPFVITDQIAFVANLAGGADRAAALAGPHKVLIDADLAKLYGVTTGRLNEQVRRNPDRFPDDFMFELTADEALSLRSQTATSKKGRGGHRYRPLAFTEQGVAMLSSVLRSARAVQVNIAIMRAFVSLREMLATHRDLAVRLEQMEKTYDAQFKVVFEAIRALIEAPVGSARKIGFKTGVG